VAETARLFVAVVPPPAVLDALAALERRDEPGVRYTTRDQWHVTLRFLGTADVGRAVDAFGRITATSVRAEVGPAVSRLGRSVVVVPVHGLDEVAAATLAATADVGDPPDPRPFAGHLTIARLKGRAACGVAGQPFRATFDVGEIHLVRSHLDPSGARHELVATRQLAGSQEGRAR
jgi:2'-5' RNA ligase